MDELTKNFHDLFGMGQNEPFARSSFEQGIQVNYSLHQYVHHFYAATGLVHKNDDISDEVLNSTSGFLSLAYEL